MKTYCLGKKYKSNLRSDIIRAKDDEGRSLSYQREVYRYAGKLIKKYKSKSVLDIGCGFGMKLKEFIEPLCNDITAVDVKNCINFCKQRHAFGRWFIDNIENPSVKFDKKFDVILSVDVIEHLLDPDKLLSYIRKNSHDATRIIISTPERDLLCGKGCLGYPPNEEHVREWNYSEFRKYIESTGLFKITRHFLIKQLDSAKKKTCQVIFCMPTITKKIVRIRSQN